MIHKTNLWLITISNNPILPITQFLACDDEVISWAWVRWYFGLTFWAMGRSSSYTEPYNIDMSQDLSKGERMLTYFGHCLVRTIQFRRYPILSHPWYSFLFVILSPLDLFGNGVKHAKGKTNCGVYHTYVDNIDTHMMLWYIYIYIQISFVSRLLGSSKVKHSKVLER